MNFFSEYIKYLFNAQGRHGIHSPFVYDFLDNCLKIKKEEDFADKHQSLVKSLKNNKSVIHVVDAGAGSRKMNSERRISAILKNASSKGVYADLLYQLAVHYQPKLTLELGTSLGRGTALLAAGNPKGQVISIDACGNTLEVAKSNLMNLGIENIQIVNDTFLSYLSNAEKKTFDLVYVDGHHQGEALKNYMHLLEEWTHSDTIFILDDIRWNKDMFAAWNELKSASKYHLSLDLFRMGILVLRPQQEKQHFTIKLKNVLSGF
jgi:predicted O-methyltransferase YrrM